VAAHVNEPGTQTEPLRVILAEQRVLADLPGRRRCSELTSGDDVAGAEAAGVVSLAAEADPRFQLGVEVGLASERQQPVAAACPLEALRVQGEGAGAVAPPGIRGHEEGAAVRVQRVALDLGDVERQPLMLDGGPGPGPRRLAAVRRLVAEVEGVDVREREELAGSGGKQGQAEVFPAVGRGGPRADRQRQRARVEGRDAEAGGFARLHGQDLGAV